MKDGLTHFNDVSRRSPVAPHIPDGGCMGAFREFASYLIEGERVMRIDGFRERQ